MVTEETTQGDQDNGATVLIDLENLIKTNVQNIERAKAEKKKLSEMLSSALENDETYRLHSTGAKAATKLKAQTKVSILSLASNKQLAEKVKTLSQEIKESKGALSDYLLEYKRISGSTQLELFDGSIREIVQTATIIKPFKR